MPSNLTATIAMLLEMSASPGIVSFVALVQIAPPKKAVLSVMVTGPDIVMFVVLKDIHTKDKITR